ncbi:uncharacterized protein BDR25DRAFT_307210 [Lindgomyces ingoldianus]|uniref:Uncharacterized protein n=1 Tax=Lindgomyces ingoldianus TaxID=673940 RepID=A0ACB6QCE0_9PLEO|nr:uncharacterized protein BDR25DRAFT_307210 [Lindgomyces ingoldianus]KAF2464520.1 hypothetical protein BDR25DRAFT_307210 [Lindgomyces ingoldianus]
MLFPSSAPALAAKYNLLPTQTTHRINLLNAFSLSPDPNLTPSQTPNTRILEIGCGQGDCTALLAHLIGPTGHIDAIDPAPLDYGSPETLGAAQARLKMHPEIGGRISFHQCTPDEFFARASTQGLEPGDYREGRGQRYDAAILCHCLWYFSSSTDVLNTLRAAKHHAHKLCVAEWSLASQHPAAMPHVLTALTRAACEAHIPDSDQNIRTLLSPAEIKKLAKEAGWGVVREGMVHPDEELDDAKWEVNMLLGEDDGAGFLRRAREDVGGVGLERERVLGLLASMLDSVKESVKGVCDGGGNVRCMDVWWGIFE